MPLLSTVIALHTCDVHGSIALSLILLDKTTFGVRVLRGASILLGLVDMIRPVAYEPAPFGNECHMDGAYTFICSSSTSRCFEIASKV